MILQAPPPIVAQLQIIPTPSPAPSSSPVSERGALDDRLQAIVAGAQAKTGETLGVVIWDLGTGVSVQRNAQTSFPMASVRKLVLAIVAYAAIDSGKIANDRAAALRGLVGRMLAEPGYAAATGVFQKLGGASALNDAMRELGFDDIVFHADETLDGEGAGTPSSIALLLSEVEGGKLLGTSSRAELLAALAARSEPPNLLLAGFPGGTVVDGTDGAGIARANRRSIIVVAMLSGTHGSDAERDAVIASIARLAYDETRLFPMP